MKVTMELLRGQHDEIAEAVDALLILFDKPYAEVASVVGAARMQIARVVAKHLKTEDEVLLTPLRERRLMASIAGCETIVIETRNLRLAYSEHIGVWTARAIEERWNDYVIVTRQLNRRLVALCDQKMKHFYPVALRHILSDPAAIPAQSA